MDSAEEDFLPPAISGSEAVEEVSDEDPALDLPPPTALSQMALSTAETVAWAGMLGLELELFMMTTAAESRLWGRRIKSALTQSMYIT